MSSGVRTARVLVLALLWALPLGIRAQVAVPQLTARVTDLTGTLSGEQRSMLESQLEAFERRKGTQIAVLILPTTAPESIEQYGIRVADRWRIGRSRVDDGAILIVAKDDRAVRIEVGYGLEGALNDAVCNRIIEEIIIPRFRQGDFYGGISAGIERMIGVVDGEPLPPPPEHRDGASNVPALGHYAPVLLILTVVLGGVFRGLFGRLPGAVVTGGLLGLLAWLIAGVVAVAVLAGFIGFIVTLLGGGTGGFPGGMGGWGYGGGGYGGYGGSSGGGGGFSGGGGRFGGGGASGRW